MDNSMDMFIFGFLAARHFNIKDVNTVRFQMVPPHTPPSFKIPYMQLLDLSESTRFGEAFWEEVRLYSLFLRDKKIRIGYSEKENVVYVDDSGVYR